MITWRKGTLLKALGSWSGADEWLVRVEGKDVKALSYRDMVGSLHEGAEVLLTSTATDRNLGTGGYLFIVAPTDTLPPPRSAPGHMMKARYTPLQAMVLGVDEQESRYHETLKNAHEVGGMPVVVADLHSALPAIVSCALHANPDLTIAYVHTDTAALPIAFSKTVATLQDTCNIVTVTAGQSYGGDFEAVNVHTALLTARHVINADFAIVIQGPGNIGTGTPWGYSGTAVGEAINAINVLGGTAIATLRVSQADERPRHRGISHHSLTAYTKVALTPALIPITTEGIDPQTLSLIEADYPALEETGLLTLREVTGIRPGLESSPVPLRTMGRNLEADYAAFAFAGAGGVLAAQLLA
ncbi:DUF3866 family protein [Flaviflexus massiliensis]|uniref:DUF3866 family protein n=1 Tax=Flaviflexus massiliensis TaxID=1522309 RepID=UPI0006D5A5C7|nr:DUF3866 family protein [Flaviflexus massiliensis]